MPSVITVENLSKKYIIGHQKHERDVTLRDALTNQTKLFAAKLRHPFTALANDPAHEEFWALREVSFEIQQGDRVGILGRNGAGKSTLLKILSRITGPTSGKVSVNGRVASLLEVGTGFHPELTGRENIYLNGVILGMRKSEIEQKFDEIVDFAEIEKFLDTPVKRYSSGMYVRLAFAIAAHVAPEILIVDEVLAVGDASFQKKCLGKMEEAAKHGRTVLFVSHNMSAIQNLCTRAIWIENGSLRSEGDVAGQVSRYLKAGAKLNRITNDAPIDLGPLVQLINLEFFSNPVISKNKINFIVELRSKKPINISGLAILIYTAFGERIAIIDLRQAEGGLLMNELTPLTIRGEIITLPLVEGVYSIGMFANYSEFNGNLLDLVDLTVIANPTGLGFTPYSARSRGVVELDCILCHTTAAER